MGSRNAVGALVAVATLAAASAAADPCQAISDKGPLPAWLRRGSTFRGPVVYVGDGDSLCVAVGAGAANWVEVRLADFYAPEIREPAGPAAKAALERLAMGRQTECRADHRSYDRIVARCAIAGHSIGDLLRAAGVQEGGRGQ